MERNSESEVYDDEILVGFGAAGMVWVTKIVLEWLVGTRRKRRRTKIYS